MAKTAKARKGKVAKAPVKPVKPAKIVKGPEPTKDKFGQVIVPGCIVRNYADAMCGVVVHALGDAVITRRLSGGDGTVLKEEDIYEPDLVIHDAEIASDLIVMQTPEMARRILIPPATTSADLVNRCLLALEQIGSDVSFMTDIVSPFYVDATEFDNGRYRKAENDIRDFLNEMLSSINVRQKLAETDIVTGPPRDNHTPAGQLALALLQKFKTVEQGMKQALERDPNTFKDFAGISEGAFSDIETRLLSVVDSEVVVDDVVEKIIGQAAA